MPRSVGIGIQDFGKVIERNCFYVDKTSFIKEWWENNDDVTLITRPRRFGKTLAMNMVERFFSVEHAGQGVLFENLSIWEEKSPDEGKSSDKESFGEEGSSGENYKYRQLQGTYPVIALSFAKVKETTYLNTKKRYAGL